jgi:hypothetical protein
MKIYDKVEHFLNVVKSSSIRLKLRGCNGGDISGNGDVCSYCSTLELIRRNPGNEDFIAFGGMFDMETINKIMEDVPSTNRISLSLPYRRFGPDGSKIHDSKEDREKLDREINAFIRSHSQKPSYGQYYAMQTRGKTFYVTEKEYDEFKKIRLPMSPVDLFCTNDLSSGTRAQAAYLVWASSVNDWIQRSPIVQPSARKKFLIPIDRKVIVRLAHTNWLSIIPSVTPIEAIHSNKSCCVTQKAKNFIFAALGISVIGFERGGVVYTSRLEKQVLNETTAQSSESSPWVNLSLRCIHIINPFSFGVGMGGFNGHARLILQY